MNFVSIASQLKFYYATATHLSGIMKTKADCFFFNVAILTFITEKKKKSV